MGHPSPPLPLYEPQKGLRRVAYSPIRDRDRAERLASTELVEIRGARRRAERPSASLARCRRVTGAVAIGSGVEMRSFTHDRGRSR